MFATLVVVLPSTSTGGELVIRHKGREARLDLRCDDPSEAAFAAFYADCVHEVLTIEAGCRLALVNNLLRKEKGPLPEPPSYDAEQVRVAELLQSWARALAARAVFRGPESSRLAGHLALSGRPRPALEYKRRRSPIGFVASGT
jgi:hypothetical protein